MSIPNDGSGFPSALPAQQPVGAGSVTILVVSWGGIAVLPAGYPLAKARFRRLCGHLSVTAPGFPAAVVPRFFSHPTQTTLMTEDGAQLSRHMVLLMANLSSRVERALGGLAMPLKSDA